MPRWTRDPEWIPERFRQNAVNRTTRRPFSPVEVARQWVSMYLNRKITLDAAQSMLIALRSDDPSDESLQRYAEEALDSIVGHHDGILTEVDLRDTLRRIA